MSTGDRRLGSARRGMTVLGKIPSVPKPINLPSQRLENRGLDISVEIVPRGTSSWGSAGRSPPTSHSLWANTGLSSSPPVSTGAWNGATKVQAGSISGNGARSGSEYLKRPSSAGSGTRPSSAPLTTCGAWSGAAKSEERLQPSRFTLTSMDFPTLGSEKNPDLRPQQNAASSGRPSSADGAFPGKERRSLAATQGVDWHGRAGLGAESDGHVAENYSKYYPSMQQGVSPPGSHGTPMGPGPNQDQLPHDEYCISPRSVRNGNMEDREMLMQGMIGKPRVCGNNLSYQGSLEHFCQPGIYASYSPHLRPAEHFGRPGHGTLGAGPCPCGVNTIICHEHSESLGDERDGHQRTGRQELKKHRDEWVSGDLRDMACLYMVRDAGDSGFPASVSAGGAGSVSKNCSTQHILGIHPSRHGDGGGIFSADEHMDFSKPLFEDQLCSAMVVPLGSEDLNTSSKDKMSQGRFSGSELLSHESNNGQSTNKTDKPNEEIERSKNLNAGEPLNSPAVSGKAVLMSKKLSEVGKECLGNLPVSRKVEEVSRFSDCSDIMQPKAVDIAKTASVKTESTFSQNLANENEVKTFYPSAIRCNKEDLSIRLVTCVADAPSPNLLLQAPGKSAVFCSTPSSSFVSCPTAGSVIKPCTTLTEKPDCVVSPRLMMNNMTSSSEAPCQNDNKGHRDACTDDHLNTVADLDQVNSMENSGNASNDNSDLRDDKKSKPRTKTHEGGKEWRPKLPAGDTNLTLKPAGDSVSTCALEANNSFNKGTSEQDNCQVLDPYDYEGQRAKLRETAAQRAKQRQKEEEERTKEQKAKALTKLVELNRRTAVIANTVEVAVSDDSLKAILTLESPESIMEHQSGVKSGMQLESQAVDVPQIEGSVDSNRHGIKNKHCKSNWERKRPLSSRDELRSKANGGQKNVPKDKGSGLQDASMVVSPLLPILPLSSTVQALHSDPIDSEQAPQQQIIGSQTKEHAIGRSDVRQRNKQYIPPPKWVSYIEDEESSSSAPIVIGTQEAYSGDDSHDEPISSLIPPLDSAGSSGLGPGLNEGVAASQRKKQNRNAKGKQRVEGLTMMLETSMITERASLVSGLSSDNMSGDGSNVKVSTRGTAGSELVIQGNSPIVEVVPVQVSTEGFFALDVVKDISFGSLHEDDYAELGLKIHNDDGPNTRIQRKSHSFKPFPKDQMLKDARVTDRQPTNEGMVWAPVRTSATPMAVGSESSVEMSSNEEKIQEARDRNEGSTSQNSARTRRAEIERYNPKLAVKNRTQLQAVASTHHRQAQLHAREMPFLEEQAVPFHGPESHKSTESRTTGSKVVIENKTNEALRPGRSHTSWRQKNSNDSYIFKEAFFDKINARGEKLPAIHLDGATKELPDPLRVDLTVLGKQSSNHHKARNGGGESTRTAFGQPSKRRSHPPEHERDELAAQSSESEFQCTGPLETDLPSTETPKSMQMCQDNTSYLSMRPAKLKSFRQHSRLAQADAEPCISTGNLQTELVVEMAEMDKRNFHMRESNRRPRSAGANNPRQQGPIDDRDCPSAGLELNHKSGSREQSKPLTNAVYHEKEHQSTQTQQMINRIQRVQKETNVHDNAAWLQKPNLSLRHDVKPRLRMENVAPVQLSVPQQEARARHTSIQSLERDHVKPIGGLATHHQRKHGSSQLQWQQAASSSNEKLTPTLEVPGPIHNRKQEASVPNTSESFFGQRTVLQNLKPLSTKSNSASAENQKINKQYRYQPMPRPSQAFKLCEEQVELKPEGDSSIGQLCFGDSSYTKEHEIGPLRRGRFNGRSRAADHERRVDHLPKQRLVMDATGGAVSSPVVG